MRGNHSPAKQASCYEHEQIVPIHHPQNSEKERSQTHGVDEKLGIPSGLFRQSWVNFSHSPLHRPVKTVFFESERRVPLRRGFALEEFRQHRFWTGGNMVDFKSFSYICSLKERSYKCKTDGLVGTFVIFSQSSPPGCCLIKSFRSYSPSWILHKPSAPSLSFLSSSQSKTLKKSCLRFGGLMPRVETGWTFASAFGGIFAGNNVMRFCFYMRTFDFMWFYIVCCCDS